MEKALWDIQDKYDLYNELKRFQLPYKVKVEPVFKKRDNVANRYYWKGIVEPLADFLGYLIKLRMHEILLVLFSLVEVKYEGDIVIYVVRSTSAMSSVEFEDYMEKIRIWALSSDEGLKMYIPTRDEYFEYTDKTKDIKRN